MTRVRVSGCSRAADAGACALHSTDGCGSLELAKWRANVHCWSAACEVTGRFEATAKRQRVGETNTMAGDEGRSAPKASGEVLMVQLLATKALTLRFALADPAASDRELAATSSISVAANPTLGQEMF